MSQQHFSSSPSQLLMIRNLHKACPVCDAPGEYRSDESVKTGYPEDKIQEMVALDPSKASKVQYYRRGWPEVWVEMNDERRGQGVGAICPCCGSKRPQPKRLQNISFLGRLF